MTTTLAPSSGPTDHVDRRAAPDADESALWVASVAPAPTSRWPDDDWPPDQWD